MGQGTGASLDFQDHRAYTPGDDPRHINWQAYARTGQYSMKLFREEVRPLVDIVLDVSPSMFLVPAKSVRVIELFYFVFEASLQSGTAPAVMAVSGSWHGALPVELIAAHRWCRQVPAGPRHGDARPEFERLPLRAQSLRMVISDLLFAGEPETCTAQLASRRGRPVILAPYCQEESDPDWDGNMEFIDAEALSRHPRRVEPALLRRYRAAYARHFDLWKSAARRHGLVMARVPSEPAFPAALQPEALRNGAVEPWD
jgi:uncharacterized protein (DUF58 family)